MKKQPKRAKQQDRELAFAELAKVTGGTTANNTMQTDVVPQ
jgi:hypothetical protein